MRITALERQPRRRGVDLHLDGVLALTLSPEVCLRFGLRAGDEISEAHLEELRLAEAQHRALAAALRLLAYRQRTEGELRERLARRGVPPAIAGETVARLRQLGLVDDLEFSRSFVESRDHASPRSRRLIASELAVRRIDRGVAQEAAAVVDDVDAAYRACARRAQSLATLTWPDFQRRLGAFLLRRGFDHETIGTTVARAWRDLGGVPVEGESGDNG